MLLTGSLNSLLFMDHFFEHDFKDPKVSYLKADARLTQKENFRLEIIGPRFNSY